MQFYCIAEHDSLVGKKGNASHFDITIVLLEFISNRGDGIGI